MARCGSTVVANMLAASPENLVYAESAPVPAILKACDKNGCDDATRAALLRDVMLLMGRRSPA
ncbi:unnamed protein product, partial [Phaeothamnion confervicola]